MDSPCSSTASRARAVCWQRARNALQRGGEHEAGNAARFEEVIKPGGELSEDPVVVDEQRGVDELQDVVEVLSRVSPLPVVVPRHGRQALLQLLVARVHELGAVRREGEPLLVGHSFGRADGRCWWAVEPVGQELGRRCDVPGMAVGAQASCAQVVGTEADATGDRGQLVVVAGVDQRWDARQRQWQGAADGHGSGRDVREGRCQVLRGHQSAEKLHPPAGVA